jgi:hypothetical protein
MNNLIHPVGDQSINFDNVNRETVNYLRELNHHFDLYVYRNLNRNFFMVTSAGTFAGCAYTGMSTDKKNNETTEYFLQSPFIHKERARGGTKAIRSSTCLKRLVRILKEDLKKLTATPRYVRTMHDRISSQVQHAFKKDTRLLTHITNENAEAVLFNLFDNKPIEPEIKDKLAKMFEKHKEVQANIAYINGEVNAFDKCYVLYGSAKSPVMFGIAERLGDKSFSFQGGVKSYANLEDLPQDFVLAYKMWKIGANPSASDCRQDEDINYHTPLHLELIRKDAYSEDFAVFTCYDLSNSILGTEYIIAIPIPNVN